MGDISWLVPGTDGITQQRDSPENVEKMLHDKNHGQKSFTFQKKHITLHKKTKY